MLPGEGRLDGLAFDARLGENTVSKLPHRPVDSISRPNAEVKSSKVMLFQDVGVFEI